MIYAILEYLSQHADETVSAKQITAALDDDAISISAVDRIHLSCKKCGKMYHMDSDTMDRLIAGIAKKNQFSIDKADTILVGTCADCQRN